MRVSRQLIFNLVALGAALLPCMAMAQDDEDEDQAEEDAENDQEEEDDEAPQATVKNSSDTAKQAAQAEKLRVASSTTVRRFHEVLDELLAEFGYDVKMGQIKGLANLALRKVRVSEAIPRTYEEYVETLLAERIRENSQVRLISCVPCKTRTSALVDGKLMVTSPATNMAKLESAATSLGIENFMDAVLVYHTTHMVLAVSVFNAQTKELVWARTYNSETVRSRYQKLAVDYSQVAKSRVGEEYVPEYRVLFGMGAASMPNVGGTSDDKSMMNVQVRATEKFNNRKTEFGMMLSLLKTTNSILNDYPTEEPVIETEEAAPAATEDPTPKAFQQALGLYGVYGHQFLGPVESYNEVRHGFHTGVGALLATGYIAPTLRLGWDVFMGRRFTTSVAANYVVGSTILIAGKSVKTKGGAGGDLILSLNY
jgi:hypothetical protein